MNKGTEMMATTFELFVFAGIFLLIYCISPKNVGNWAILAGNALFYAFSPSGRLLLFIFAAAALYLSARRTAGVK